MTVPWTEPWNGNPDTVTWTGTLSPTVALGWLRIVVVVRARTLVTAPQADTGMLVAVPSTMTRHA